MIGTALSVGAARLTTAAPAAAWPLPLTSDQINFLNSARGAFPGDDDELLLVGEQVCHSLFSGQPSSAVIVATASQYGASPDQAASVLHSARATLCTQAPG
jgi:hypothetical protein